MGSGCGKQKLGCALIVHPVQQCDPCATLGGGAGYGAGGFGGGYGGGFGGGFGGGCQQSAIRVGKLKCKC